MNDEEPTLEFSSEDSQASVRLVWLEVVNDPSPSVAFGVEAHKSDFRGANPEVWVASSTLSTFVEQLERIERSRSGEAVLRTMSPEELELKVAPLDSVGHLKLTASLGWTRLLGDRPVRVTDRVVISFELDPACLRRVLEKLT